MICKVKNTLNRYSMFNDNRNVVAGVSGGADSCAMLYALYELKDEFSLNISVAHVNHGIRGEQADDDEKFVKNLCEKLGVPFYVLHCNVPGEAKKANMGLEEYGRKVRYEFFEKIADGGLIATAHNLNDCCETLLFNITRGSSVRGLKSIPAVRGKIIRPLIDCTREEIEAYCTEKGISYVTDCTNADPSYARNRIRLNVIPELKKINPSFESAAQRLMIAASDDENYFCIETEKAYNHSKLQSGYNAAYINGCHPAIKTRLIAFIIEKEIGTAPESNHVHSVIGILNGGKTQILKNTDVTVKNGVLNFGANVLTESFERELFLDKPIITPTKTVQFKIVNKSNATRQHFVHKNVLDFDCVKTPLVLRSRKAGDEIRIAGRNCTKSLKKLFTESKITDKNSVCVLSDADGPVWVEGFGCAERCAVTDKTKNVLKITFFGKEED